MTGFNRDTAMKLTQSYNLPELFHLKEKKSHIVG